MARLEDVIGWTICRRRDSLRPTIGGSLLNEEFITLLRAASDFIQDLQRMGYGEDSELPLPPSYDAFLAATEAAREHMIDQALDQGNG